MKFYVIGDYGDGSSRQRAVAVAMAREMESSDEPVRFVLTTGDNIYGTWFIKFWNTGKKDQRWGPNFFQPFAPLIRRIPFYASPGNHDGNGSESADDLPNYLDNFFFPRDKPEGDA